MKFELPIKWGGGASEINDAKLRRTIMGEDRIIAQHASCQLLTAGVGVAFWQRLGRI